MRTQIISILMLTIAEINMAASLPEAITSEKAVTDTSGVLVTSDGSELPYFIEGEGIPCFVLGDPFVSSKCLSEELRNHIQFIFMYSRENVPSECLGETDQLTLEVFLNDIDELRRSLNLNKVCIFGHSIYGIYALAYAQRYPQYTSHVIMHSTPPGTDEVPQKSDEYWQSHASEGRKEVLTENWESGRYDTLGFPNCSWCLNYVKNGPKYWYDSTFDASSLLEDLYSNPEVNFFDLLAQYDVDAGYELTVPVFVAVGIYDFVVPYFLWEEREVPISNLTIHVFQRSGHCPMYEEQELFDEKLLEWIHSVLPTRSTFHHSRKVYTSLR